MWNKESDYFIVFAPLKNYVSMGIINQDVVRHFTWCKEHYPVYE